MNRIRTEWRETDGSSSLWVILPGGKEVELLGRTTENSSLLADSRTLDALLGSTCVLVGRLATYPGIEEMEQDTDFVAALVTLSELVLLLKTANFTPGDFGSDQLN